MKLIMVLAMCCNIIFPESKGRQGFSFRRINSAHIEQGWEAMTDTAEISIARKYYLNNVKGNLSEAIRRNDPIIIQLGYNGVLNEEFRGFVSQVIDDVPVVIKCEDNMWDLKRIQVNKSYQDTTLLKILKDIIPAKYTLDVVDVPLGDVSFEKMTVAKVLQTIKDRYGLYSYFKGDTLVSGKIYTDDDKQVVYNFQKNVFGSNLEYKLGEDIKLKVTMQNVNSDGSIKKITLGDKDGEEQKLVCRNLKDEAAIKKLAEMELDRLKVDGFKGDIITLGIPFVKHGYTAKLVDSEYDREGKYYIDGVVTDFNPEGFRRTVKIGKKAAGTS